ALGMALILRHYALPHPFTSFSFMAIAITSWYAGTGPGLLALLLSYLAMSHFSIPNRIGGASSESYLIIYGIFGLLVSWFSSSRRRADRLHRAGLWRHRYTKGIDRARHPQSQPAPRKDVREAELCCHPDRIARE